MSILKVENVYKKFGKNEVLKGVGFEMEAGQVLSILGSSGSGKTTFVEERLWTQAYWGDLLYLIDTRNGNEQIVSANSDIATYYSDTWFDKISHGWEMFSEDPQEDKIVVMTYAKFGVLAQKDPEFAFGTVDYIICDEIHNLINFMTFGGENGEDKNWYVLAKLQLEEIVKGSGTKVIGLSATPSKAEKHCNDNN